MKEEGGRVGGGEEGCGAWMVGSDMMVYIHIYTYISSSVGGWVVELQDIQVHVHIDILLSGGLGRGIAGQG